MGKSLSAGKRRTEALLMGIGVGVIAIVSGYCHIAAAGGIPKPPRHEEHPEEFGIKLGPGEYMAPVIRSVPLVCLLTTPEKYDGKLIHTMGYVVLSPEECAIYCHKEDADNALMGNCIALRQKNVGTGDLDIDTEASQGRGRIDPASRAQGHYCIIEGMFYAKDNDHMRPWGGTIGDIERLEYWSDPAHPYEEIGGTPKR